MYQNARNPPSLDLLKFLFKLLPFFLVLIHLCYALYEDQIGKFDWRQQYIGKVKFAYIDPTIAGTHKFHVATEENVLACLSTRTGSIIWRQVLENGQDGIIDTMSESGEIITVSGRGQFIRSWDLNTGVLLWETSFPNLDFKTDSIFKFYINTLDKEIILVELQKTYAKVYIYSFTRATMKTSDHINAPSVNANYCKFLSSRFFLCLDETKKIFHLLSIKDSGSFIAVPLKSFGIEVLKNSKFMQLLSIPHQRSSENPLFALQIDQDLVLFQIQPPRIALKKIYSNTHGITSTIIDNELVIFLMTLSEGGFNIVAVEVGADTKLDYFNGLLKVPDSYGAIDDFFILPYVKRDQAASYKVLLSTVDHAMLLIHQQSRLIWTREEALANVIAVEILDLPLSERDANIEQEFSDSEASVVGMLFARLKSQLYTLENLYHHSLAELQHSSNRFVGTNEISLARDTFGLHKVIIALTKPGKIYGIDNLSGQIIWSHYERELLPFNTSDVYYYPVFVQRTTAHYPYPPQCTILAKHKNSPNTYLYSFNPITGKTIDNKLLPFKIIQSSFIGSTDHQFLRGIILLDSNLNVHIYPEKVKSVLLENKDNHYMVVAHPEDSTLIGYSFGNSNHQLLQVQQVWIVKLPNKIVHVALKRPFEHVHSQGRVMGDRSVLYKYLNPNLAAVFTEGNDATHKSSFCNIHLIDTITGLVIYSASHKKCKQPIKVVHSENWIVYSYYNDKSRRMEVSTIELYEGMSQSNTTAFSSFVPPQFPLVEHQTFIFPSSIETMIDTVTERGMTNKHVLIGLPTGGILELPKTFLDPRRPINLTPEHREEGLIPYIPELPIMFDRIINYNQSIMRIQGIQTAPSALESTCLVFAYGLDLYYTRVTPSKTFDILKDDFDHYLIAAVLLGLLLLSYTTKRLAARKSLKAAWK